MSSQEFDRSTKASEVESDALATSNPIPKQSRFNVMIVGIGLIGALLLLLAIAAFSHTREEWYKWILAGLITGFGLGAVFGLWIGRHIGNAPNLQRVSFAGGIVVLNACVGFFAIPYLTSTNDDISVHGIWPKDPDAFYWSIGTATTIVSATIMCLVNFFWYSRDQHRIQTLRAVLNKNRAGLAEAQAKLAAAQRRTEEAERRADEERTRAEQAQQEADQARTTAHGAQRSAQQAQQIAEKEKRWRSNRALLLGRWQCVEYVSHPKNAKPDMGLEIHKELEKDKDVFFFGADERFSIHHPGNPTGFLDKIKSHFGNEAQATADSPTQKTGRWKLDEDGESVFVLFEDGTRQTLKIQALKQTTMTIDKSGEDRQVLRLLVKIG